MSSIQDIYNAVLTLTQSLNNLVGELTRLGGTTYVLNGLSTAPTVVLGQNPNRSCVTFHNPNLVGPVVWVYPSVQASSTPIAVGSLGGCYQVLPGAFLPLTGGVKSSWLAFASSGTGVAFTAAEQ